MTTENSSNQPDYDRQNDDRMPALSGASDRGIESKVRSELFANPKEHEKLIALVDTASRRLPVPGKDKASNPVTEEKKIEKLIGKLGDLDRPTQIDAQRKLEKIGPKAIPALKKAMENPDPEIRMRAENTITAIQQNLEKDRQEDYQSLGPCLDAAAPLLRGYGKLLQKAGVTNYTVKAEGTNRSVTLGEEGLADPNQRNPLTEKQMKAFDALIEGLDAFKVNDPRFIRLLRRMVDDGLEGKNELAQASMYPLATLNKAHDEARRHYADILSQPENKDHQQKGLKLLTEYIQRTSPSTSTNTNNELRELALRLNATENQAYLTALEKNYGKTEVEILQGLKKIKAMLESK